MGIRHILWTKADASDSEHLRTHFTFTVPTVIQRAKDSRALLLDPLPPALCQHVSDRLTLEKFDVSKVWRGKPWGAGIHVRFAAFEIHYMLMAEPLSDQRVTYFVFSWCSRPFWKHPPPGEVAVYWQKVSDVIERVLGEDPRITSLRKITRQEGREHRAVTKHA